MTKKATARPEGAPGKHGGNRAGGRKPKRAGRTVQSAGKDPHRSSKKKAG
jgi:hypothetical protein